MTALSLALQRRAWEGPSAVAKAWEPQQDPQPCTDLHTIPSLASLHSLPRKTQLSPAEAMRLLAPVWKSAERKGGAIPLLTYFQVNGGKLMAQEWYSCFLFDSL